MRSHANDDIIKRNSDTAMQLERAGHLDTAEFIREVVLTFCRERTRSIVYYPLF